VRRRLLTRALAALLIGAAAWYLSHAIAANWQALREHEWRVDVSLLGLSLVAHVAVLAWGVAVWGWVLRQFAGVPVPRAVLLRIWFLSNLARYVPGKIFQFVAVAQLGRAADVPAPVLLASLLVHTAFALLSAVVLAAWTIGPHLLAGFSPLSLGVPVAALAILLVHPGWLNRSLHLLGRLVRRELHGWHGSWRDGIWLLSLSVLSWVFYGIAYYLLLVSLTPIALAALPLLAGVNALSFVAGYLAIVTPGGLGVREAAMTGLLLPLLPPGVAAVLAIAARLWTIAAELIGGAAALLLWRRALPAPPLEDVVSSEPR
jgi:glycosyltransferase 2 family protein